MKNKLTDKEQKEPLMITFGRIKNQVAMVGSNRLQALVNKLEKDLEELKAILKI